MCGRFIPLALRQLLEVIEKLQGGGSLEELDFGPSTVGDVYPGDGVQLILPLEDGVLAPAERTWGFDAPWSKGPIFNTRLETAVRDADKGHGFWSVEAMKGRCIVPCRGFYEPSRDESVPSPRTGRPVKAQYYFQGTAPVLFMAGLCDGERFSVVTREPDSVVAPIHDRMPMVLAPDALGRWLGPDWRVVADDSGVSITAEPDPAQRRRPHARGEGTQGTLF